MVLMAKVLGGGGLGSGFGAIRLRLNRDSGGSDGLLKLISER